MTDEKSKAETTYLANPNYAAKPGEIFDDFLKDHDISIEDAALIFEMSCEQIEWIIDGSVEFPDSLAERIEELYHVPTVLWENVKKIYQRVYGHPYILDRDEISRDIFVDGTERQELQLA
ncbi:MAG: hypothetical protein IJU03_01105 [Thermoguttaceae bacterium]|nr:hypothetical protein [Thermoguttaceae bacterium]